MDGVVRWLVVEVGPAELEESHQLRLGVTRRGTVARNSLIASSQLAQDSFEVVGALGNQKEEGRTD